MHKVHNKPASVYYTPLSKPYGVELNKYWYTVWWHKIWWTVWI